MRTLTLFTALFLIVISAITCKKPTSAPDPAPNSNVDPGCVVAKIVVDNSTDGSRSVVTVDHDAQYRPTKQTATTTDKNGNTVVSLTEEYTYTATQVSVKHTGSGSVYTKDVYNLSNGLVNRHEVSMSTLGVGFTVTVNTLSVYERDAEGYVTKVTDTQQQTTAPSTVPGMNFVATLVTTNQYNADHSIAKIVQVVTHNNSNDNYTYTTNYEYGTEKVWYSPFGMSAMVDGVRPGKLPAVKKMRVTTVAVVGGQATTTNSVYDYNNQIVNGLIAKYTVILTVNSVKSEEKTHTYNYRCK